MKKLGILGCQSKHAEFFGSLFNIEKAFPGYQVHYLFGDDEPERLPYVQRTAGIPTVCHSIDALIEQSEVVLITYRESQPHFAPAMACFDQSKTASIDNPPRSVRRPSLTDCVDNSRKFYNVLAWSSDHVRLMTIGSQ